jgi:hypothetical protein
VCIRNLNQSWPLIGAARNSPYPAEEQNRKSPLAQTHAWTFCRKSMRRYPTSVRLWFVTVWEKSRAHRDPRLTCGLE